MEKLENESNKKIKEQEEKIKDQENKIKDQENKIKEQEEKIKEQEDKIKEQKNKFAKELLSYASSFSMPLKGIKYFVKKILSTLQNMKNTKSEIKPIRIRKRPGTTYCFRCNNYTQNFRSEKLKMTNKILREKSHCVACGSNKSRFLKQKINQQLML